MGMVKVATVEEQIHLQQGSKMVTNGLIWGFL